VQFLQTMSNKMFIQDQGFASQRNLRRSDDLLPKDSNQPPKTKSFAPKGSKPKQPMELPRPPKFSQEKESRTERANKRADNIFGKIAGATQG
jgi:hypothetical protein